MNEKIVFGNNGEINIDLTKTTKIVARIIYYIIVGTSLYFIWDALGFMVALSIFFLNASMIIKNSTSMLIFIDQRFMKLENKEVKDEN